MIHVLLMILKIIGILLLVILGLLLTAILLALFVPVRYRADVSFDGKPDGEAAVIWLLQAVRIRVSYHEHADVSGRVLWFKLFDIRLWPPEDEETGDLEFDQNNPKRESAASKPAFSESAEQNACLSDPWPKQHAGSEPSVVPESLKEEDELVVHTTEISSELDVLPEGGSNTFPEDQPVPSLEGRKSETEEEKKAKKIRTGFTTKIREKFTQLMKKLRALFTCIRELPGKIQKLADGISKKKISLEKTWNSISMFWHDEQNQKAFRLIRKRIGKLVRYVLPRNLSGRIHFGFDDPYDTGQVLAAVSPFYGFYAKTLTLEPDFTGTALDGEIHLKGRIALWYPLWTAARLFISKDFRRLLRFIRKRNTKEKNS